MQRRLRKLIALAAPLTLVVAGFSPTPVRATAGTAGEAVVTGGGTISPGLTATKRIQTVNFTGRVTGTVTAGGVTFTFDVNCNFTGGTTGTKSPTSGEDILKGRGKVFGGCSGTGVVTPPGVVATIAITCDVNYARTLNVVTLTARCSITALGTTQTFNARGEFEFIPTTANPTTSYLLAGSVTVPDAYSCSPVPDKTVPCKK